MPAEKQRHGNPRVFQEDWAASEVETDFVRKASDLPLSKTAKKMAKVVSKNLPLYAVVKTVAKAIRRKADGKLGHARKNRNLNY